MLLVICGSCLVASPRIVRSAVAVGSGDDVVDGALVVELQVHRLCQRPLELVCSCGCRQVEQGAVDRRDRDAFVVGGVLGIEGTGRVQADPRDGVTSAGGGHVDALLVGREQLPMGGRAAMAQDCARPAGQDCRQPMALRAQQRVAQRVHAVVDAMQPPRAHGVLHGSTPDPDLAQLRARQHPKLSPRQRRRPQPRGWSLKCIHAMRFRGHPPRVPGNSRQRTPQTQQLSASAHTPRCPSRIAARAPRPISSRPWHAPRPRKPTSSPSGAISPRRCRGRAATR